MSIRLLLRVIASPHLVWSGLVSFRFGMVWVLLSPLLSLLPHAHANAHPIPLTASGRRSHAMYMAQYVHATRTAWYLSQTTAVVAWHVVMHSCLRRGYRSHPVSSLEAFGAPWQYQTIPPLALLDLRSSPSLLPLSSVCRLATAALVAAEGISISQTVQGVVVVVRRLSFSQRALGCSVWPAYRCLSHAAPDHQASQPGTSLPAGSCSNTSSDVGSDWQAREMDLSSPRSSVVDLHLCRRADWPRSIGSILPLHYA